MSTSRRQRKLNRRKKAVVPERVRLDAVDLEAAAEGAAIKAMADTNMRHPSYRLWKSQQSQLRAMYRRVGKEMERVGKYLGL